MLRLSRFVVDFSCKSLYALSVHFESFIVFACCTLLGWIFSLKNLPKFIDGKNWYAHRIQHTRFAKKLVSDGQFELFLIDFLSIENRKADLLPEILEQIWVVQMKQFFLHSKVQPNFSIARKIQLPVISSSTGNDVIKNPWIFNRFSLFWRRQPLCK